MVIIIADYQGHIITMKHLYGSGRKCRNYYGFYTEALDTGYYYHPNCKCAPEAYGDLKCVLGRICNDIDEYISLVARAKEGIEYQRVLSNFTTLAKKEIEEAIA